MRCSGSIQSLILILKVNGCHGCPYSDKQMLLEMRLRGRKTFHLILLSHETWGKSFTADLARKKDQAVAMVTPSL